MGAKKCVEWGFGYGESEYEVGLDLVPRDEELWPSNSEATKTFLTLRSVKLIANGEWRFCVYLSNS